MKNHKPACFKAYQLIKHKIIRNEFDSTGKLNEIDLSKELDLSRTPVREALIMLEKDELITRYEQNRGFYIKQYSIKDIYDIYEFRKIIEFNSAGQLLENISDRDIEELEVILKQVRDIIEQERPADALVRAVDFHLKCIRICTNNSFMIKALQNCYEKMILTSWSCQNINTCISSADEHDRIIEAIKDRNLERLIDCTGSHIQGGRDRILNLLKEDAHKLYIRH